MQLKKALKNKFLFIASLVFVCVFFVSAHHADAASLYVSGGNVTVSPGQTFTVSVNVNSQGVAINDASGTIQFPASLLNVLSVSKGNSIFSIWVEEPSFSNSSGSIMFEGGVPNPGFTGTGNVVTITLQAKAAGQASVAFSDAAVRANDGNGTNVLSGQSGTTITIAPKAVPPPVVTPPTPATTTKPTTPTTKTPKPEPVVTETPVVQTVEVTPVVTPAPQPESVAQTVPKTPWYKILSSYISRTLQSFALTGIYGLLTILLVILLTIIATYQYLRLRGKLKSKFLDDYVISNTDSLKMLMSLRKRLEKHLEMLQAIRHDRILTKTEKSMKADIESDLDGVDKTIAKQNKGK